MKTISYYSNALALIAIALCLFAPHAHAEEQTLIHNGIERQYIIRRPHPGFNRNPLPTVIVLHGGGGNGESAEYITSFTEKAYDRGYMVVYPSGTGRFPRMQKGKTWNAVHCCAHAMKHNVDDIGFINALIDHLIKHDNADAKRIYVTGMSNGAMITHRLGIELSDKIAAIAPVIGTMFGGETVPSSSVPAFIINGKNDTIIPIDGGKPHQKLQRSFDGTPMMPALYQSQFWARVNQCNLKPDIIDEEDGKLTIENYQCPDQGKVIHFIVNDGNHSWPGGRKGRKNADAPPQWMDATELILEFFSRQEKQL
ncbi:MAG: dienelactone hydrolase family protein [Rickettsiales bacterium]|nr:dienelactone hydrolase family protein [Rickettsiales bacterium]